MAQTIALTAHSRGLGTCLMTSVMRAAPGLHEALPETDGFLLVAAITLGYADKAAPINHFPRTRIAPEEFLTHLG